VGEGAPPKPIERCRHQGRVPSPGRFLVQNVLRWEAEAGAAFNPAAVDVGAATNVLDRWIAAATRHLVSFMHVEMGAYRLYTVRGERWRPRPDPNPDLQPQSHPRVWAPIPTQGLGSKRGLQWGTRVSVRVA
jgi:hypothetical protein